jgi:hypothetical protein
MRLPTDEPAVIELSKSSGEDAGPELPDGEGSETLSLVPPQRMPCMHMFVIRVR